MFYVKLTRLGKTTINFYRAHVHIVFRKYWAIMHTLIVRTNATNISS